MSTTVNRVYMDEERETATSVSTTNISVQTEKERGELDIEVYRKATYTDHSLLSDSHHPMEHELEVIWTSHHWAETISTNTKAEDNHTNIRR